MLYGPLASLRMTVNAARFFGFDQNDGKCCKVLRLRSGWQKSCKVVQFSQDGKNSFVILEKPEYKSGYFIVILSEVEGSYAACDILSVSITS
jgi:hypothetical protein